MTTVAAAIDRVPAGWYLDPDNSLRRRWWDGEEWTEYVHVYAPSTGPHLRIVDSPADLVPAAETADDSAKHGHDRLRRVMPTAILIALVAANALLITALVAGR